MKCILIHVTGLATEPIEELEGRTLLEASATPALDELAQRGSCGTIRLLPEGAIGGAGAELLGLLGYLHEGAETPSLGALEALGIGAPFHFRDVAFRVNLGSVGEDGSIADTSGAGIATEDALTLMQLVDEKLSTRRLGFYPGRHFAHVMVWTDGPSEVRCVPAPLARGQQLEGALPVGEGDGLLRELIWDSVELLDRHRINHRRREEGLPPVNLLWPWAPGRRPEFRHYALRTGLKAHVLAQRLEVLGAAKAAGIPAHEAPRTLPDCRVALQERAAENSLAYLHVDIAAHCEDPEEPELLQRAYEALDTEIIGPVLGGMRTSAESARLILLGPWPETTWAERPPALWGMWPSVRAEAGIDCFTEAAMREQGLTVADPERLLREAQVTG
jgi:2,3-bisphosphoglycerate-independent phosphoglycerate mutase